MKPLLSVVVPVHNVEEWLGECLRSLAGQTLEAIEVVLVDDGSTDGSRRIAEEFAARDGRFRCVHQPNAGLSAARNTGVRHTTPGVPYLAFADSDDVVVHDAYARMVASLESSGSDLVTGNVWRLTERGRQQAWQYRWLTATRSRTHITRDARLLADRVAWNKVFRRSFWDRHAFAFPEGKLYEDTPVMIPAHYLAGSVDVLHEHVYHWRVREGSITRRRTDVTGVRDRIAACEQVSAFLAGRDAAQQRRYDVSCLRDDFLYFLEGMTLGSTAYRTAFMADAGAFLDRAGSSALDGLPVELRVKWRLVRERRLDDLLAVLAFERANGAGTFAVEGLPGRRRAVHPGVSREGSRLGPSDLPAVARLLDSSWGEDGRLRLRGYAYIRNLPADTARHALKWGMLRSARGRQVRAVPVRSVEAPRATVNSAQELHSYDRAGFEMVIDPRRLRPGSWLVGMVVSGHGVVRRAAVRAVDAASAQPLVHDLGGGRRAVLGYRDGRLELTVAQLPALAQAHDGGTGTLELTGRLYGDARPEAVLLALDGTEEERTCPLERGDDGRFTVRIPLAALADVPPAPHRAPREVEPEGGARWRARLLLADGSRVPLAAAPDLPPPATACPAGELVIDVSGQPVVDGARWTADGGLLVEGTGAGTELVLRHEALRETAAVAVTRQDGRFTTSVTPELLAASLQEGRWDLLLDGFPARATAALTPRLPLHRPGTDGEVTLERRHGDRLTLHAGPALAIAEQGAFRRRRLRTRHYPEQRGLPLRDAVLYVGGDSPRAVHAELVRRCTDVEHLWVTTGRAGRAAHVPDTAAPVVEHSAAWYEALARARRIVTDDQLPEWFERRPGQTVVQTWHGSPLGRFGTDLDGTLYADHHTLASLPHRAAQWSVLVSPSRFATPHLRRALAYGGEVLEAGSPAADLLFSPGREKTAERVRRRTGIPEEHRVVLYAPTYRDHLAHDRTASSGHRQGPYRWDPALDTAALARSLGAGHTVLVRRHPRVTGSVPAAPGVLDVSAYPDTSELLLIADVLVTDYAGLVFDYAHTGRPMLFHTYDLEHYRDTVRGFCLDFETRAPGPLLVTTDEVAQALRTTDGLAARHADAYESFRRDYCDLDDGGAAGRVADRLLADGA
ncbi:CDP-glycerol glycerophosphotransferase family protein [Streptomyces sp. NBC_00234]|uniref:bifunctional glycosyltransferase/CDP-glycerol:glycerophosphate glycerophosphotransferase n=1 Tax=Streptomyces sp. NBC_00234 TaxID=2903638 RepID=UPI002E2BAD84|nr:CDP-glycerol glycerophosphotransferase family protein [Streptomyces sp. NBC_00234]